MPPDRSPIKTTRSPSDAPVRNTYKMRESSVKGAGVFVLERHQDSWITDIHHLRLAGQMMWGKYKDIAATRVVDEQCPKCSCGIVGLPGGYQVICPNCSHGYCRRKGCYQPWPEGAKHTCDTSPVTPLMPGIKLCPTPGCTAPIVHYFKHGCHHIGTHGGCPVCKAHFCYQCQTLQNCDPQCHHGAKDTCPCPLFCPNDGSCGCPICSGCSDFGGACRECGQCKAGCRHSDD
eukprot:m.19387 g.19387  ORF g.19387 m.19387 type:complete len:232 (+) comp27828_c0_seq5:511-1206(+)